MTVLTAAFGDHLQFESKSTLYVMCRLLLLHRLAYHVFQVCRSSCKPSQTWSFWRSALEAALMPPTSSTTLPSQVSRV